MNGSSGTWLRWEWANSLRTNTIVFSPLHLHAKVSQCPVFSYNSFAGKGLFFFFFMLWKNSYFIPDLSSHSSQDGLSVTAQPFFADQDLDSARVHQNITSLFISEKNNDPIKLYLSLWDSYLVIRNRKVLPATRLSHSRFSMPLNVSLLKLYLWPETSLGQSPPATLFLQNSSVPSKALCMLHVPSRRVPSFRPSSPLKMLWGVRADFF